MSPSGYKSCYILMCIFAPNVCVCVANHRYWKKMLLLPVNISSVFDRACIKRQGGRSIYFTIRLHCLASPS